MLLERARMAAVLSLRRPRAARAVVVVAGMVTVERVMPVMAGTARATVLLTLEFSSASLLCLVAAKMAAVFSFRSPRAPRVVARSAVMAMVGTINVPKGWGAGTDKTMPKQIKAKQKITTGFIWN